MEIDWGPLILTLKLALITNVLLLMICIPLAYWLFHSKSLLKPIVESLVSLPLVLPPTVLGFYFLILFSPSSWIGNFFNEALGLKLVFSFPGLVLASMVYSLPFMVHPIHAGFSNVATNLSEAAYTMGRSKWNVMWKILLPNIKPSLWTGIILAFAHTVGEFGVVLLIGGNIPDKTRLASIAIYDYVESMSYNQAHLYSFVLFAFSFIILFSVYFINGGYLKKFWK